MKKIGKEQVRKARQTLAKYKEGKAVLDKRIVSNEQWWKLRHWGEIGYDKDDTRPMPASAWLFNSLANKHADAMDNIPEPAVLPREKSDEEVAKQLSLILPAILERCGYEKLYSDGWWYKLKNGSMCCLLYTSILEGRTFFILRVAVKAKLSGVIGNGIVLESGKLS